MRRFSFLIANSIGTNYSVGVIVIGVAYASHALLIYEIRLLNIYMKKLSKKRVKSIQRRSEWNEENGIYEHLSKNVRI